MARSNSFTDRLIGSRKNQIHRIKAKDITGRTAYYFVLVDPVKEAAFLADIKAKESIDLSSYGQVLASNYGEAPSEAVRQMLKERYDIDV